MTDCNVMVGKLHPEFFPQVFGATADQPLDRAVVEAQFRQLTTQIQTVTGQVQTPEEVAHSFLAIAVETMAMAIKKISVQRGYDLSEYTLCCFGGAGGQHACLIADALGMHQVFLHPLAGVLSAYGMGLADLRVWREQAVEALLSPELDTQLTQAVARLAETVQQVLWQQAEEPDTDLKLQLLAKVHLRYQGTDAALMVPFGDRGTMIQQFEQAHQQRYGFMAPDKPLIVESIAVEGIRLATIPEEPHIQRTRPSDQLPPAIAYVEMYTNAGSSTQFLKTPIWQRLDLQPGDRISGPAILVDPTSTLVVEPGWEAQLTERNHLLLNKTQKRVLAPGMARKFSITQPDPMRLELFNHRFRAIAEQMGITLQNTSYSVNIKERLDFSCALFDHQGHLIANAPHIPVHLGSMGDSVESLITAVGNTIQPGTVYASNNPYRGGTHLPDITVITPVFLAGITTPSFYVASRGHHADIGGITPGSMPPHSRTLAEEGILLDQVPLVIQGQLCESDLLALLTSGPYPARNPQQNLADLKAQIAANERGVQALQQLVADLGLEMVQAYMGYVQDYAESCVRQAIHQLQDGHFIYPMDDGSQICVTITIHQATRSVRIDFTGTSPQQDNNLNAPLSICKAAVLYVFRTLVAADIPLNAGCLRPLEMVVPEGCLLHPRYPAAVVAGNVETSQAIVDALYGALGLQAASQGTMNNFTFGNGQHQYYETICGGSGAGAGFAGTDAVQTHMTNSRLTDPEVLEWRFPVQLESFEISPQSGGTGQYPGGNGVIRRLRFCEPMTAAILSGHRIIPPFGLRGGAAAAVGRNWVERQDGTLEVLDGRAEVEMQPGDVFVIATPGGGGYGPSNP
ncbi:hydantoinase B/oxoprolinase family protein [Neosynechococcus sphagnicola]|uniref:hydantoinase B/oxoprolinase family protein n=1 Tax=Neosynechococcus sphagnicola TaxID=1501145 RepID=UPI00308421C9